MIGLIKQLKKLTKNYHEWFQRMKLDFRKDGKLDISFIQVLE